jgi:DNA-binding CsgD family transcriptional regulator
MHPERRRQFIDAYRRRQERGRLLGRRLASLTERERTVLDCLAKGQRAQSIADECMVSVATVRTQIRAILGKLDVGSQLEAVVLLNDYQRAEGV